MRKRLRPLPAMILAIAVAASAAGCDVPLAGNGEGGGATESDVLGQLLAAVDAKSDEEAIKKLPFAPRGDVALPKALRALLLRDETESANLRYGFESRDGRLGWYWRSSVNSLRLVGNHRVLRDSLISHMKRHGFEQFDSPDKQYRLAFRKQHNGALESALFVGCNPVTGGRVDAVETRFVWRVEAAEKSPLPCFRQVTSAMPTLEPPSQALPLPSVGNQVLPDLTVNYVSASGSNSVLYSLQVRVSRPTMNDSKSENLSIRIAEKLNSDGFNRLKPRTRHTSRHSFAHSTSAWRATIRPDKSFLGIDLFVRRSK